MKRESTVKNKQTVGRSCIALLVPILFCSAQAAATPPEYAGVDIGAMLGVFLSEVTSINEDGDAVGSYLVESTFQSFIYTFEHGAVPLLPVDGFPEAVAVAVSDRDLNGEILIAGTSGELGLDRVWDDAKAIVWRFSTVTGTVIETIELGTLPGNSRSFAIDINNSGNVIGYAQNALGTPQSPFVHNLASGVNTPVVFPVVPASINNNDEIAGGTFVGDLAGNSTDLGFPPTAASANIVDLSDSGLVGAGVIMPFTDGAGRFVKGAALYENAWDLLWANSAFDAASGINEQGDMVGLQGISAAIRPALYLRADDQVYLINTLFPADRPFVILFVGDVNSNLQIGGSQPASLLTPLGSMIIPGDVNGDADVSYEDLCLFRAAPFDINEDGVVDDQDEQWLINRLESLGLPVNDCNANGIPDPCDVLDGFSLDCNENFIPDECEPDCDGDGIPDDCESDCNGNGVPDDCDIALGTSDDCNANGIPDECDGAETVTAGITYNPPQQLLQDSTFTDTVLMTDTGTIADVDFAIDLSFRIGQVTIILHHAGVSATLVDRPGPAPAGFSNLGYDIVLDDEGTGGNIQNVGQPFSQFDPITSPPAYQPNQPLSVFDGLQREGEWTLEFIGGFQGTLDPRLDSWSISVTDEAVDTNDCSCPGDFNGDGSLDFFDISDFISAFNSGDLSADFDGDGNLNFFDVSDFLAAFSAGCP